jgi:hypothetical protein
MTEQGEKVKLIIKTWFKYGLIKEDNSACGYRWKKSTIRPFDELHLNPIESAQKFVMEAETAGYN